MARLIALHLSPWSEKARWALDHHRVPYAVEPYMPMLGEPLLRLRTGRLTGHVTVPILFDGDDTFFDSFSIARHAERKGSGTPLFPAEHLAEITRWNDRTNEALTAGRTLVLTRMKTSLAAQKEALPSFVPPALRPTLATTSQLILRFMASKYDIARGLDGAAAKVTAVLDELRAALDGRAYLLDGELTYADLAAAVLLQMVRPVRDTFIRLGPATRTCWTSPELEARYPDLIEWRDQLYDKHRRG